VKRPASRPPKHALEQDCVSQLRILEMHVLQEPLDSCMVQFK